MYKLLNNTSGIKTIDCFNSEYAEKTINICPLLSKFQIVVSVYSESKHKEQIRLERYDAFGCHINCKDGRASSTYAEIFVNIDTLSQLCLTKLELFAALAHEIGHIMLFFHEHKEQFVGLGVELYCDQITCRIGLATPLKSLLEKLIQSELLPDELEQQIESRLVFIDIYND